MSKNNIQIAVCISGLLQHWSLTSRLFRYWNSIYDNVDFTFFLSTWKDGSVFPSADNHHKLAGKEIKDVRFSTKTFDFIEQVDFLSTNSIPKNILDSHDHTGPFMSYQLHNVQSMRKRYEESCGKKFDVVVQTREDMFIFKNTLDEILNLFEKRQVVSGMFFSTSGTKVVTPRVDPKYGNFSYSIPNDNFFFSHSDAMDNFAQMYNDCYIEKTNHQTFGHFMHAQQLINKNIYNFKVGNQFHTRLIRDGKMKKKGIPSSETLEKLLNEKGVEWIYEERNMGKRQNQIMGYFDK